MSGDDQLTDELTEAGSDTVYRLYGMLMHQLQLLEMNLWAVKALHFKPGVQLDQGFAKLEAWDTKGMLGQLVGELKGQLHWPEGMIAQLELAARIRNYLAHRFLREFFLAKESVDNYDRGIGQLAAWLEMVARLDEELESHVTSLDGGEIDPELAEEFKRRLPASWPLMDSPSIDADIAP